MSSENDALSPSRGLQKRSTPQSIGDIAKAIPSEDTSSPDEHQNNLASVSTKWETSSDPGAGGSLRSGKKALPVTSSYTIDSSTVLECVESSPVIKMAEESGAISHSSSTASVSTASSAQQLLLHTAPNTEPLFYVGQASNSTSSLSSFLNPQQLTPDDQNSSIPRKGKMENAFRAVQSYFAPTYADQDTAFHKLFDSLVSDPPLDRLIYDSACAVNRELLYSGRIFVSQCYICFYSGMFKQLQIVIPFSEVTKLRKEKVLRMVPTAIEVFKSDGERCMFINVNQRDIVFQIMQELWQNYRNGTVLSSGQIDQKIRQFYGQPTPQASSTSPAALVDIRWRNGSNDEDTVDFLQSSGNNGNESGIAFQTNSSSTSSVNSVGRDEISADLLNADEPNERNDLLTASGEVTLTPTQSTVDTKNKQSTLKLNSNSATDTDADNEHVDTTITNSTSTKSSNKPTIVAVMKATTVGTAVALPDGSGSPQTHPRRRHREHLVHSESVQGVSEVHPKLGRCRSRSTSSERRRLTSRNPTSSYKKERAINAGASSTAAHEPTPTPTPSPSPTATANDTVVNAIPYPPADFNPCRQHQHLKRVAFDEEVALPPEFLIALIFGPSEEYNSMMVRQGASQIEYPPWEPPLPSPDVNLMNRGELPPPMSFPSVKSGTYCLQLGWAVGPRYANLLEKHTILSESRPGVYYMMERETSAPGMPYGQDFFTLWRYCIRRLPPRHPGDKLVRSHLLLTGEVRYRKSIWRAFQTMIERNAQTGIDTFMTVLRVVFAEESQKYANSVQNSATTAHPVTPSLPETPSVRQSRTAVSPGTIRPSADDTHGRFMATDAPAASATAASNASVNPSGLNQRKSVPRSVVVEPSQHSAQSQIPLTPFAETHGNSMSANDSTLPLFARVDQWLISHPQIAVRALLAAVTLLLFFTFFLARRVADVEEHLLRNGLFVNSYSTADRLAQAPAFQSSPELGSLLTQLSNVAGQLSDSLAVLAETMRNNRAHSGGASQPTGTNNL